MNVLQHTKNERNPCLKQNRPDRSYRDTLLILTVSNNWLRQGKPYFSARSTWLHIKGAVFPLFLTEQISKVIHIYLAYLINHLVERAIKCRFICSSDRWEPKLRDRCSWKKIVTIADFKSHPRQKYGSDQRFFDGFQRWNDGLQWGNKISVVPFWQGETSDLKVIKYLNEFRSATGQAWHMSSHRFLSNFHSLWGSLSYSRIQSSSGSRMIPGY